MRRTSAQNKTNPISKATTVWKSLRYSIVGAWAIGLLDSLRGHPTSHQQDGKPLEEQAFYEKQISEYFYRLMLQVEEWAAVSWHRLEATKQLAVKAKKDCEELFYARKKEHEKAAEALRESVEKYGYSAWSWRSVALLVGLFIFEMPLNYLAFSAQGDAPLFTLAAVLAVSVIIPAASHLAGERLKQEEVSAKLTGFLSLLLLLGLITCIAVFRMRAFEEIALRSEIADLNSYVVTGFYLIIQTLFVLVATQQSHAHSRQFDKVEAIKLKVDKERYNHARADYEKLLFSRSRAEQALLNVAQEQALVADLKAQRLDSLTSRLVELTEIYRRTNVRWRKSKTAPPPPSWLEPRTARHELQYRNLGNNKTEPIQTNGHNHRAPEPVRSKPRRSSSI